MPSNADKLTKLIVDNFDLDEGPNFNASFSDLEYLIGRCGRILQAGQ